MKLKKELLRTQVIGTKVLLTTMMKVYNEKKPLHTYALSM